MNFLTKVKTIGKLIRNGQFGGAAGLLTQKFFRRNFYLYYLSRRTADGEIPIEVHGITMYVSVYDQGISYQLLHYGTREEEATKMLRKGYSYLASKTDSEINVLEIGANRGYYAFQAADLIGEKANIHAIEPGPDNVKALKRGTIANGFEDLIIIDRCAIGNENTTEELKLSTYSNCHTLGKIAENTKSRYDGTTLETDVYTVEQYLENVGMDGSDVDVVRMDIEGYEWHAFKGMSSVIKTDTPLLLFIELHPHRVSNERINEIMDIIEKNGFNIVHASSTAGSPDTFSSLRDHLHTDNPYHSTELIVQRGMDKLG